jgi:hypothetical protein
VPHSLPERVWGGDHTHLRSRTCPSTMKNMPFKRQEDALLDAKKASSSKLFITD